MARALAAFLLALLVLGGAHSVRAQSIDLTLIRAVRVSDTSLTLSFKTEDPAVGEVTYAQLDGSRVQLTDSSPQVDHLFVLNQLDPGHGYSFALSARDGAAKSDTYTVLLSPDTIGEPGTSLMPGVRVTNAAGAIIATTLAASSAPATSDSVVPWWVFVLLLVLALAAWVAYLRYGRRKAPAPLPWWQ